MGPILECHKDVVIAAGTAAGKTEAAFLPILSRLNEDDDAGLTETGCRVLYVAPLKALINDQHDRLTDMTEAMDIPVVRWHGDASQTLKRRFLDKPDGILQITPESLEAIHVLHGNAISKLFKSLRYVVVDELHAFIGVERGRQLQSLLHRIAVATRKRVPRIGLSATLGEPALAARFLRPGGHDVVLIEAKGEVQDVRLQLRGYVAQAPNPADDEHADPRALVEIAQHLFQTLRGSNNLIFANSRGLVETLASRLRVDSDRRRVPNEFWPHHGNLSRELREQVERELKARERPVNVVCTSTLEMGIDVGWVCSVAQVGVPPSVASMRQRLGRSGRRGTASVLRMYVMEQALTPDSHLRDRLRVDLVQLVAMTRLMIGSWVEPPEHGALHLSTLVHQILSVIAQFGGATAQKTWTALCEEHAPFQQVTEARFAAVLRAMGESRLIEQNRAGLLLLGEIGERIVASYKFYAVFQTPDEYTLIANGKRLGSLPIDRPVIVDSYLIFAGRRWLVVDVDDKKRVIQLKRAPAGKVPRFGGNAGRVHDEIRREMRRVYAGDDEPAWLNATALDLLAEGRQSFRDLGLSERSIVPSGYQTYWFTWRGDRCNDTWLAYFLSRKLRANNDGAFITLEATPEDVEKAVAAARVDPTPEPEALARRIGNKLLEKYDWTLSEDLQCVNYASSALDVGAFKESKPNESTRIDPPEAS